MTKRPSPKSRAYGRGSTRKFAMVTLEEFNSPAYRALSYAARDLLIQLKMRHDGYNTDRLVLPYAKVGGQKGQAHMNEHTLSGALAELEAAGWIDLTEFGGLERRPNRYALVDRWRRYGETDFVKHTALRRKRRPRKA